MRKLMPATLLFLAVALAASTGCTRDTGGGEARYLTLFSNVWQRCHTLGLYQAKVEAVTTRPDGNKRVVVAYVFDNGMVPDQGRAAMLVAPNGRLASDCVLDLEAGICLCGAQKDWHDGP
ncbi:conserved hypothetical protein [Solidesulfovibrio fructosivorans JJ]]|uniref:Lipoprotein n=1 Tax=Solidesulfovibrio fructosivorans JJ] TaxID=596151 RepID=E1JY80_SOLFR|nr:hypothetical protein [Solidesulfovibrio fructosivorans]EFL50654.1 conserved hypothetical protein [Solidesulfovibrio fructosivorans JJ]]